MTACAFDSALLQDYLDERLDDAERHRVANHLADCAACRKQQAAYLALDLLLREAPTAEPPAFLVDRVLQEIDGVAPEPTAELGRSVAVVTTVLTGAALLFAFGLFAPLADPATLQGFADPILHWAWSLFDGLFGGLSMLMSDLLRSFESWWAPAEGGLGSTPGLLGLLGLLALVTHILAAGHFDRELGIKRG